MTANPPGQIRNGVLRADNINKLIPQRTNPPAIFGFNGAEPGTTHFSGSIFHHQPISAANPRAQLNPAAIWLTNRPRSGEELARRRVIRKNDQAYSPPKPADRRLLRSPESPIQTMSNRISNANRSSSDFARLIFSRHRCPRSRKVSKLTPATRARSFECFPPKDCALRARDRRYKCDAILIFWPARAAKFQGLSFDPGWLRPNRSEIGIRPAC